ARFVRMLLDEGELDGQRVLSRASVAAMLTPRALPSPRTLALDSAPRTDSSGAVFAGVGHTGFTGTSFWLDRASKRAVVLLSNRRHPDGRGDVRKLRQEVVTHALDALAEPKVLPGLDVLESGGFADLRGRRVALLTNRASRDLRGRGAVALLASAPS